MNSEMGLLVGAYIDLGAIPVAKNPKTGAVNPLPFPASIRRSLVGHLDHIPLITQQIEVDPSAAYEGVPHLVDIGSTIAFAGGVNAPKVVRVTDSSGRQQRQLVKSGSDDLRQVGGREGEGEGVRSRHNMRHNAEEPHLAAMDAPRGPAMTHLKAQRAFMHLLHAILQQFCTGTTSPTP
jgi:hypothetical protein